MRKYTFKDNKSVFLRGIKAGIPIGLGYLTVSFSLGIAAKDAGLSPFQGFLASLLCIASAGEYVGFTLIGACATYIEIAIATFVANARYLLMSCAMSQRIDPNMAHGHRIVMGYAITDEIFGVSIAQDGYLNPIFTYGTMLTSIPLWAAGTALGIIAGNLLPLRLVSAFSVALYAMFLAVVIPPARTSRIILGLVITSFVLSYVSTLIPFVQQMADGTRIIILTVIISAVAALLFPVNTEKEDTQ